jgi:signal peptidase I
MVSKYNNTEMRTGLIARAIFRFKESTVLQVVAAAAIGVGLAFAVSVYKHPTFNTVGRSMSPTLQPGDVVVTSRVDQISKRGKIALFDINKLPEKQRKLLDSKSSTPMYVKRVVGLPGDNISFDASNGAITSINKQNLPAPLFTKEAGFKLVDVDHKATKIVVKPHFVDAGDYKHSVHLMMSRYSELNKEQKALLDKLIRKIQPEFLGAKIIGDVVSITVPKGHYFIMSDNRTMGIDSRHFGFVPFNALVSVVNKKIED